MKKYLRLLFVLLFVINIYVVVKIYFFSPKCNIYFNSIQTNDKKQVSNTNGWEKIYDEVKKTVVQIKCIYTQKSGNAENTTIESGTGVITYKDDNRAYIVTNAHIINSAGEIKIYFGDNEENGELVLYDKEKDICVISVTNSYDYRAANIGNSETLKAGESICSIGNIYSREIIITTGIICSETLFNDAGVELVSFDAFVDEGCSGGALINSKGQLIGIVKGRFNTGYAQSIGVAIPINDVIDTIVEFYKG